ncbi:MAG: diacylglycerol kinase family protein [Alphaproteobacteria bacterium]
MTKIGVISNPHSHRNKRERRTGDMRRSLRPGDCREILSDIADLPGILADFARREVGVVVIDGGDGTVQATLTALFNGEVAYEPTPLLTVLRRGMTNVIGDDVGLRGRPEAALARLVGLAGDDDLDRFIVERNAIRLSFDPAIAPRYGMFFGGAAIYRATLACRKHVHPLGASASAAIGLTLSGLVLHWLISGGRGNGNGVLRGDRISVAFDDDEHREGCYFAMIVSTLDRLTLNSRPFWGPGDGALRYTSVAYPPRRFVRSLFPLLYGGPDRNLPNGDYVSRTADVIALSMTCPFVLDGELFTPVEGRPVVLSGGRTARFVRC